MEIKTIITIATFGAGGNSRGSTIQSAHCLNTIVIEKNENIQDYKIANVLRELIRKLYNNALKTGIPCSDNYHYYLGISITNLEKDKVRFKNFKINPNKIDKS